MVFSTWVFSSSSRKSHIVGVLFVIPTCKICSSSNKSLFFYAENFNFPGYRFWPFNAIFEMPAWYIDQEYIGFHNFWKYYEARQIIYIVQGKNFAGDFIIISGFK